ncbi:MAG: ABC transporter permease [Anaerolineae bacterium]|nr:ABC transporter permease [Anaerolineae bacterium]
MASSDPQALSTSPSADARRLDTLGAGLRQRSLWSDAARRFARNKVSVVALVLVLLLIGLALFAPLLASEGYDNQVYSQAWRFPSSEHIMGTDPFGRDVLSRIIWGARISMLVALVVQVSAVLVGIPIGAIAGWYGGKPDYLLMRVVDVMSAFPTLLFAILLLSILGSGLVNVLIAMAVTRWISIARLVRGQFFSLREKDFVAASQAIGAGNGRIIRAHLLPNALSPLIVNLTLGIPEAIVGEAGLSFLGIGVNAPMPSWGKMLNEYLPSLSTHWYLSVFPALMIALAMYAFTLLGDGLRDALDPSAQPS